MKKFDRNQTIQLLEKAKEIKNDIFLNYSDVLPSNITDGAQRTVNEDLPHRINVIFDILNMQEKTEKYKKVATIDEAIEALQNEEIDLSIEGALKNTDLVGYSQLRNEKLSIEEILDNAAFAIDSGVQYLHLQRVAGKLSKGENLS